MEIFKIDLLKTLYGLLEETEKNQKEAERIAHFFKKTFLLT